MSFGSGTQGATATANVAADATYQHNANSTIGTLHTAGTLDLGIRTLTIFGDYDNANFGTGNAFNRRANVSNASGFVGRLDDTTLVLRGDVATVAVPEPETYLMLVAGLAAVAGVAKRRQRREAR